MYSVSKGERAMSRALKVYEEFPHGMCATQADMVNPDLHAFVAG